MRLFLIYIFAKLSRATLNKNSVKLNNYQNQKCCIHVVYGTYGLSYHVSFASRLSTYSNALRNRGGMTRLSIHMAASNNNSLIKYYTIIPQRRRSKKTQGARDL